MASTTFLLRVKYGIGSKMGTDKKTEILPSTVYNFSHTFYKISHLYSKSIYNNEMLYRRI